MLNISLFSNLCSFSLNVQSDVPGNVKVSLNPIKRGNSLAAISLWWRPWRQLLGLLMRERTISSDQAAALTNTTGFCLVLISLDIWHQVQGPQKLAYTQSLQTLPCREQNVKNTQQKEFKRVQVVSWNRFQTDLRPDKHCAVSGTLWFFSVNKQINKEAGWVQGH